MEKNLNNLITVISSYGYDIEQGKAICCPVHNENTASFFINTGADGEAYWKCFGCDKGGDMYQFVMEMENIGFAGAKAKVCEILGVPNDTPSKLTKFKEAFAKVRPAKADDTYQYDRMHLYMNADNDPVISKVIWKNATGKKEAVTYKVIDKGDYYEYGTKKKLGEYEYVVYNYPRVKDAIDKGHPIYFVEGEKDADNLIRLGKCATTIIGKNNNADVWEKYQEQLRGAKIVFIGDTGEAGKKFRENCWNNLKSVITSFKVVTLPGIEELGDNKDVTDWLEAGHTKEELVEAVSDAWDWKISTKWKDINVNKNKKTGEIKITPKKTLDNFKIILDKTGTRILFNEISKQIEVKTKTFRNINLNTLATEIQSYCIKDGFNCTRKDVMDWLDTIGYNNSYNPFKTFLDGLNDKWDGNSRLDEFCGFFKTVEFYDDDLKKTIFRKWLLQFVDSAYNPNFKSQGLLVLKGGQGIYKSTSMSYLIPIDEPWVFLAEQKYIDTRDGVQTITSNQLVELSEFARSAKAVDALKGFVTSPIDRMVLKYDKYPIDYKRKTVFYATINDDEFLLDDSNRRFWIVDLESVDLDALKTFDYKQLWAELYHIYHVIGDKKCWFDKEELKTLEQSNQRFKFKSELEGQIELHFDFNSDKRVWMTTTEVIEVLGKPHTPTKVSRTLKSMGIEKKRFDNKKMKNNRYFAMPYPRWWKNKLDPNYKDRVVNAQIVIDNVSDNADMEQLKKENEAIKKLLYKYKAENIELQNKVNELEEAVSFYENNKIFK